MVYNEKDANCNHVYFIKNGDFSVKKKTKKIIFWYKHIQLYKDINVTQENNIKKLSRKTKVKKNNFFIAKKKLNFLNLKIKLLTSGELVGEEKLVKEKKRNFKLVCESFSG